MQERPGRGQVLSVEWFDGEVLHVHSSLIFRRLREIPYGELSEIIVADD